MVDISEVKSGLACDCTCPCCGGLLQANKGEVYSHYFSHDPSSDSSDCFGAVETAIHKMAKQIIEEEKSLLFPEYSGNVTVKDINGHLQSENYSVQNEKYLSFDSVVSEKNLGEIRPDITALYNDKPIVIEIAVTNSINTYKKSKIHSLGYLALEIKIDDRSLNKQSLKKLLLESPKNKVWIFHPEKERVKNKAQLKLNNRVSQITKIDRVRNVRPFTYYYTQEESSQIIEPNEYDVRWFLCDACRHLWSKAKTDAPYSLDKNACPDCGHNVSMKTI